MQGKILIQVIVLHFFAVLLLIIILLLSLGDKVRIFGRVAVWLRGLPLFPSARRRFLWRLRLRLCAWSAVRFIVCLLGVRMGVVQAVDQAVKVLNFAAND